MFKITLKYCLNCFHSFRTENKLKSHKNVYENHDYSYVKMPEEDSKILKLTTARNP